MSTRWVWWASGCSSCYHFTAASTASNVTYFWVSHNRVCCVRQCNVVQSVKRTRMQRIPLNSCRCCCALAHAMRVVRHLLAAAPQALSTVGTDPSPTEASLDHDRMSQKKLNFANASPCHAAQCGFRSGTFSVARGRGVHTSLLYQGQLRVRSIVLPGFG
jgi:hypothetical protein